MKFVDVNQFEKISLRIEEYGFPSFGISAKLEGYMSKMTPKDKAVMRNVQEGLGKSPDSKLLSTSFGSLLEKKPVNTFVNLISTLNLMFEDYEFSSAPWNWFKKKNVDECILKINNSLENVYREVRQKCGEELKTNLWEALNGWVNLDNSTVYSFKPDSDNDPFAERADVWYQNYFFVNEMDKRIVFFRLVCRGNINYDDDPLEKSTGSCKSGGMQFYFENTDSMDI